jgi:choline dehydrogenase-like flavoprotein
MLIRDLRTFPKDENIEADICIVGSGPAGATIARELSGGKIRVVIVESGDVERQPECDALNEIESVGFQRVMDQWIVRNRVLGGSSYTWAGRCAPFDEIDYEARDWVPYSGWPFGSEEMNPFLERTITHLGLGIANGFTDSRFWHMAGQPRPLPDVDEGLLRPFFWQFSKDDRNPFHYMRFGRRLLSHEAVNVSVITNATAAHINTNTAGTMVQSVEVASPEGERWAVSAPTIVLCAGGIENARLLLASNRVLKAGLGNQNDLVGRFLMDHPRAPIAKFDLRGSERLQSRFGLYNVRSVNGTHWFRYGLALSPTVQRREGLLNCAVCFDEVVTPDDPWNALKRLLRGKAAFARDVGAIASNLDLFAMGLYRWFIKRRSPPRKLDRLGLTCIVEQRPDPDSRITLAGRVDRLGMPLSRIDWRISDQEQRTVRRMGQLVVAELTRLGMTPPILEDWVASEGRSPPPFRDIGHPTGTTRMSLDPKTGVVDADCQVHGVEGLYSAGSSVFPTTGHANPTQMIVALAVRLADTLKALGVTPRVRHFITEVLRAP